MQKKTLIASALLGATAFSLAVALPANADTTATVAIGAAELSSTIPIATTLSEAAPGQVSNGSIALSVKDLRGGIVGWTTTVKAGDFTSATVPEGIIPAASLTFPAPAPVTTGDAVFTPSAAIGSLTDLPLLTASNVNGNNSATWTQAIHLAVPADTLSATDYTSTIVFSTI